MSASPASPEPRTPNPEPSAPAEPRTLNPEPTSRKLPPAERDFEIYEAVHIAGRSTWSQAELHQISQTRVRQIVRRVVEWLGEVLPPQAKVAKEQETYLARQIAADRFQHQYEHATTSWNRTQEVKYASLRIRLTTAQARLGVVGGRVGGLVADAIEGIPVPAWQPPAEPNPESNPPKADENPKSSAADASAHRWPRRRGFPPLPPALWDPISFDELTPEIVAARAALGSPIPPSLIKSAQESGRMWRHAVAARRGHYDADASIPAAQSSRDANQRSSPPDEDFSPADADPAPCAAPPVTPAAENPCGAPACVDSPAHPSELSAANCAASQPLLIGSTELPATSLQITPNHPGVTIVPPQNTIPFVPALSPVPHPLSPDS